MNDCLTCKYALKTQIADKANNPVVGEFQYSCRRFPPSAFAIQNAQGFQIASAFPVVAAGMVCSLYDDSDGEPLMFASDVPARLGCN